MEVFFTTLLLSFCLIFSLSGAGIIMETHPARLQVGVNASITIQCSLNLKNPTRTDVVYSILMKKRGSTVVVVFQNDKSEIIDPRFRIEKKIMNQSLAYVQIRLDDVITCEDRGEYFCLMAVRRSYRNLQLGPAISHLKVDDVEEKFQVHSSVVPDKSLYNIGDIVEMSCYTLHGIKHEGWVWQREDHVTMETSKEACHHSDADCMYKCSSIIKHVITRDDDGVHISCGIGETSIVLRVSNKSSIQDNLAISMDTEDSSHLEDKDDRERGAMLKTSYSTHSEIFTVLPVFVLVVMTTLLISIVVYRHRIHMKTTCDGIIPNVIKKEAKQWYHGRDSSNDERADLVTT